MLLNYSMVDLRAIKGMYEGNSELCWCHLMEEWLFRGFPAYPASWEGLHSLLVDSEAHQAAKLLKHAVIHAIHPPTPPHATEEEGKFVILLHNVVELQMEGKMHLLYALVQSVRMYLHFDE